VLVTVGAVDLHALDLLLLLQMWIVGEVNLFGELDLLGLELVIRLAVAVGGQAAGIDNPRPGLNRAAAEGDVGETLGGFCRNVFLLSFVGFTRLRFFALSFLGRVVTLDATDVFVFPRFPQIVTLLHDARVRQNVAVTAEKLGLGYIRWRQLGQ
jgi:hypothetical protein